MRRKDRELPREEALKLLEKCEYGVLSLVDNGVPYAVPVSYVYAEGRIYIHCATEGKKLDCIAENPNAVFTVVGETKLIEGKFSTHYESAIANGAASLVTLPDMKRRALIALVEKYFPETANSADAKAHTKQYIDKYFERTAVIEMSVLGVTGKANKN